MCVCGSLCARCGKGAVGEGAGWESALASDPPVRAFQKRMCLSAVPPPEARVPCWCGDHPTALTAAQWSEKRHTGSESTLPSGRLRRGAFPSPPSWGAHTRSSLSLPPEARRRSSKDHFRPQTY